MFLLNILFQLKEEFSASGPSFALNTQCSINQDAASLLYLGIKFHVLCIVNW